MKWLGPKPRRQFAAVVAALGVIGLAACSAPSDSSSNESDDSVTVGFLAPLSGTVAAAGKDMREGWELYWEQHGDEVNGVTVKTIFEDAAGDPKTALNKAKRLVQKEEVDVMVGPLLSNSALAVSDYVTEQGVPSLQPITAADELTQQKFNPLMLR